MFKAWFPSVGHNGLWSKVVVLFGVSAALVISIFMYSSLQAVENKRNAESIYKLNQQISVVKHISVLAQYFDRNIVAQRDNNAAEQDHAGGMAALPRKLNTSHARNELRDLGRQLEFINASLQAQKEIIPKSISRMYFDGEHSTNFLVREYVASAYKLSQLSSDNQNDVKHHIDVIAKYQKIIDDRLHKTVTRYYQHLGDLVSQQNQNYWHYLVVVFTLFALAMFFYILRPLQKDIEQAYEQAALANRIKTEFLTSVSHEIRTPMHGIISAGENLDSTRLDNKQKSYVKTIMSSADALLDVVNDILGYSSLETGDTQVELTRFNLFELTHDLIQIMEERAQLKSLELIMRYEDGVPHEVGGDSSLIRQVIYHLLSNSIKFTESGYIVVTVDMAEPLPTGDLALKFSVEDTGIGIEESKLSIIFEQFVQGNGGTKRLFSGTGLGLSICKKLVELMGGSIRVGSVLGEGATFSFTIPLNLADNIQRVESPASLSHSGSIVFVCDDKEFKGSVLAELGMSGLQVVCVTSQELMTNTMNLGGAVSLLAIDYFVKAASPSKMIQTAKALTVFDKIPAVCITRKHDEHVALGLKEQGFNGIFSFPADTELFTEFLTTQKTPAKTAAPSAPSELQTRTYTANVNHLDGAEILLVEDNRINAALAEDMLLDFGATVTLAENGKIAVDTIRGGRHFDLVLMDCMMPVMDGFEATKAIRALPQTIGKTLPIIALTANAMVGDKERCLDSGMNAYLSKPVRKKDLQQTMSKWLQHRQPVKQTAPSSITNDTAATTQNIPNAAVEATKGSDSQLTAASPTDVDLQTEGDKPKKPMLGMQDDGFDMSLSLDKRNVVSSEVEHDEPATNNKVATSKGVNSEMAKTEPAEATAAKETTAPKVASAPFASLAPTTSAASEVKADDSPVESVENSATLKNADDSTAEDEAAPPQEQNTGLVLQYLDDVAVVKAKSMMKRRFPTMIEYFLEDTQNYLEQIKEGLEAKDYSQLVVPSHTIKSSSRQMGAFAVSDLAREIESLARSEEGSFETLLVLTEQLQEQFDLSRIDFNYLLSEAG